MGVGGKIGKDLIKLFWNSNMEYATTTNDSNNGDNNNNNNNNNEHDEEHELPWIIPGHQVHGEWEGIWVYLKQKGGRTCNATKKGCETRWFTIGEAAYVLWMGYLQITIQNGEKL